MSGYVRVLEMDAEDRDELAQLRAENERLRAALNEIWGELSYMDGAAAHRLCGIARSALEPENKSEQSPIKPTQANG